MDEYIKKFLLNKITGLKVKNPQKIVDEVNDNHEKSMMKNIWITQDLWKTIESQFLNYLKIFYPNIKIWQNNFVLEMDRLYLCSIDLEGMCGDIAHLNRDGEVYWTVSGDYDIRDEELIDILCKSFLFKY